MKITDEQRKNLLSHADDMDACGWKDDAETIRTLLAAQPDRSSNSGTTAGAPKWIAFADQQPPVESNGRGDVAYRKVLVTNNVDARDAFGDPSHVWLGSPLIDAETGAWRVYEGGKYLTHWFDPFGAQAATTLQDGGKRISTKALRAHAEKGWGDECLLPKDSVKRIANELDSLRAALASKAAPTAMTEPIQTMVDRFLAWPLPSSVCADMCATNNSYAFPRSGTNLLNGIEAEAMIRHVIGASIAKNISDDAMAISDAMRMDEDGGLPPAPIAAENPTAPWRVVIDSSAGASVTVGRPFVLRRRFSEFYCPGGCLKRWESEEEAQHACSELNSAIAQVPDEVDVFLAEVRAELRRARAKFPGDRIMTIALAEEFGELCKAMLDESRANVRKEAVQTAVMAARVILDGDGSVNEWRAERGLDRLIEESK